MNKSFYTHAFRHGKVIKYCGFEEGKKVSFTIPFKPTLYVTSKKETNWHALDGTPVDPVTFGSMSEATDFMKQYKDVPNFKIFGNTNYVAQHINEEFPGDIKWDRSLINVTSLDIECKFGEGFPDPADADQEITAITMKNNIDDIYYTFGCGDYDVEKALMQDHEVRYIKCNNEYELLSLINNKHEFKNIHLLRKFDYDASRTDPYQIALKDYPDMFIIEKIIKHYGKPRKPSQMTFDVKWEGYDEITREEWINVNKTNAMLVYLTANNMQQYIPKDIIENENKNKY